MVWWVYQGFLQVVLGVTADGLWPAIVAHLRFGAWAPGQLSSVVAGTCLMQALANGMTGPVADRCRKRFLSGPATIAEPDREFEAESGTVHGAGMAHATRPSRTLEHQTHVALPGAGR